MTKVFTFPELLKSLDSWAEFLSDSPVALAINTRLSNDILDVPYKKTYPHKFREDLLKFAAAVYQGGVEAGRGVGAIEYASTRPKAPEAIRVWGVWETVDEFGRHGTQIGWFTTEEDAKIAANRRGWYGGPGSVVGRDALRYDGVVYILDDKIDVDDLDKDLPKVKARKIAEAKSKLTAEELALLGLKP